MTDRKITIADVLAAQHELQVAMGHPTGRGYMSVKENVLAAIVELTEVLDEVPWKPWKKFDPMQGDQIDREALLTEMCDVLQFWANMVNAMGFTAENVAVALSAKWSENYRRTNNGETTRA